MNSAGGDWAWPALIQSLQHDIAHLRELMDDARRESVQAREAHRREIDALIDQLRHVRSELEPIIDERKRVRDLKDKTWWTWLERAGWAGLVLAAYAVWHWIRVELGLVERDR